MAALRDGTGGGQIGGITNDAHEIKMIISVAFHHPRGKQEGHGEESKADEIGLALGVG